MARFVADLLIAGFLALLAVLLGGCQSTQGFDVTLGVVGDPLGIQLRIKALPPVAQQTPRGWTTTQPAITPATLPATTAPAGTDH